MQVQMPLEVVEGLCAATVCIIVTILIFTKTRLRFSMCERRFIQFFQERAKKEKIEKVNLPGFYFSNIETLQAEYLQLLALPLRARYSRRLSDGTAILHVNNPLDIRNEILSSYRA